MERVDGAAQVGGLWISPDALNQLSAGQELDYDPVTQASVSVSAVDATDSGFTVTIHESGAGEVSDIVYDGQSGLLVASSYATVASTGASPDHARTPTCCSALASTTNSPAGRNVDATRTCSPSAQQRLHPRRSERT